MATAGTITNLVGGLRRKYDTKFLGNIGWSKSTLAAMIPKAEGEGEQMVWAMRVGNSAARSVSFSKAQTLSQTKYTRLVQPRANWFSDYGVATIDGKALRAAKSAMGGLFGKFSAQLDGILDATMHSFSTKVYRKGFGKIGTIAASTTLASTTIVLDPPEDVVNFEIDQEIQFAQFEDSGSRRNSAAVLTVTGINHSAGTVTVNANINTVTGVQLGDSIFSAEDRNDGVTRSCIPGMDAWFPVTVPSAANDVADNLDRRNDGRLLGVVVNATTLGLNEEAALIKGATECGRYGGRPNKIFMNPTRYGNLLAAGQSRFRPAKVMGPYGISFDGVTLATKNGDVDIFPDMYCPRDRIYGLEMKSLKYWGLGSTQVPEFLDHDGIGKMLRQTNDDGVESRVGYYGTIGCDAPIHNFVIAY